MVLGCKSLDSISLYTSATGLEWKIEAEIPDVTMGSPQLDWAEDGTLLLGGLCARNSESEFEGTSLSAGCRLVALRKPQGLGEAGLWTILPAKEGFIAHRAMRDGQALVVTKDPSKSNHLKLMTFRADVGLNSMCKLTSQLGRLRGVHVSTWKITLDFATLATKKRYELAIDASATTPGTCTLTD